MKRVITKYSKQPPYDQVEEHEFSASSEELAKLFNETEDEDMICVYKVKTQDQVDFFKEKGFPVDMETGHWFAECYVD